MTQKNTCPNCKKELIFYDGCLGYAAMVCENCGYFEDNEIVGQDDCYIKK